MDLTTPALLFQAISLLLLMLSLILSLREISISAKAIGIALEDLEQKLERHSDPGEYGRAGPQR